MASNEQCHVFHLSLLLLPIMFHPSFCLFAGFNFITKHLSIINKSLFQS
nr:MAG TPA: hypothetical protein [Herelleviridae sp.]